MLYGSFCQPGEAIGFISILWPFNTFYVISGVVSYSNHTVPGQVSQAVYQHLVHILSPVLKLTTALLESAEEGTVELFS